MTVRAPQLLTATALLASAWWVAPPTNRSVSELARPIAAPLVLPFVWTGIARARQRGDVAEVVGRCRELMRLLPSWVDGHLYLAQSLAFDRSATTADAALDQLLASLALLAEAIESCPEHAAELLVAQAFLVDFRTASDPELAKAYRLRLGVDPLASADGFLARAAQLSDDRQARVERAFLAARMIGPALRDGDVGRAIATLDRASDLLEEAEELYRATGAAAAADHASGYRAALARLRSYLEGETAISPASLRADPYLEDIADDLPHR